MTPAEIQAAVSLAESYLAGGDLPPLRADTTAHIARALLALAERCGELEASRSKLLEYETLYFSALNTISELEATISRKALAAVSMGEGES